MNGFFRAVAVAISIALGAADRAASDALLTNVTLVDVKAGTVAEAQSVLIDGDRIAEIGATVSAPEGVQRLDASGAYPTAQAFAHANARRLAKPRYDGCHFVGPDLAEQLVAAAKHSVGQHHGPVYALQALHICQDRDLWHRRLTEIDRDIEGLLDAHEVGKLLLSIDGLGLHSVARIIAAVGDPARFRSAGAFAAYVGVVPSLRQSGKQSSRNRATITPMGNARLRRGLWMTVLGTVRRNPWLHDFYQRLRVAGKPAKLALIAAMSGHKCRLLDVTASHSTAPSWPPSVLA